MNKGFLTAAVVVMILGVTSAKVLFDKTNESRNKNNTYMLELGSYDTKESLVHDTRDINDFIVLKENNKFLAVVGLSKNKDNLEKVSKLYNNLGYNLFIKTKNITNKAFNTNLEQFDKLLKDAKRDDEIRTINSVILSSYEELIINKESM
ncbi:MAG: hypothetical protein IK997_06910 [Bacilli bacterium]|nr:hypothetical protein [Bacilli bacterium]